MQTIKLNLIPGGVLPVVNISQYDVGRHFAIQIYEGAASYDLTGKSVQIRGTKPDGNGFAYDATDGVVSVSGSTVTISTTQQMTAVGGQTMAELRITQSGVILGTLNFVLMVEPSALSDDTPISDTDIPAIERDFQAALDEAEADALVAEGYAKGTQNGTPAASGEPYYQDNAKYYKEQAEAAASGGGADALKAEGYAVGTQNGVPVGSGSPYYQNNAKYYEGEAATSASNASTSETNAGLSETAAGNSANAAAADALEAEGFAVGEQNGTPVSSGSPYYHNNAKYYSEQANPTALSNLTDVNITTPSDGQALIYDANSGEWVNGAGGGGSSTLSGLSDVTITSATSGQALVYDGSKWVNDTVSGVPTGGTTNQVLAKNSNTDGDTKWVDVPSVAEVEAIRDAGAVNQFDNTFTTQTIYGVTCTKATDKHIDFSGTASRSWNFKIGTITLKAGVTYKISGGYDVSLRLDLRSSGDTQWTDNTDGKSVSSPVIVGTTIDTFTPNHDVTVDVNVRMDAVNQSGRSVYPMIYDAALGANVPYQPHEMTNVELTDAVTPEIIDISSYFDGTVVDNIYRAHATKIGKIVILGISFKLKVSVTASKQIATLPSALAPAITTGELFLSDTSQKYGKAMIFTSSYSPSNSIFIEPVSGNLAAGDNVMFRSTYTTP